MNVIATCRIPFLRAVPEAGALRFRFKKNVPNNVPPPPMPVVEVVTDPFEIGRQKFKERERMSGTHENTKKVEKHVAMNMKLIPEGAAPFLKTKVEQGYAVKGCPLCLRNLQGFSYTDVLILRQYVDHKAEILPRQATLLCPKLYRKMKEAIELAKFHNLLPTYKTEEVLEEEERHEVKMNWRADMTIEMLRASGGLREDKLAEIANTDQKTIL